jgi:holo-[acyl-carrier protein] synthase
MIHGIGTDIIEVKRVKKTLLANRGFRDRVFSAEEVRYCEEAAGNAKYERYAARFAAKEAFLKACGTGLREGFNLAEITVVHTELKQPRIRLTGKSKETFESKISGTIHLTISHLSGIAHAVSVIEK